MSAQDAKQPNQDFVDNQLFFKLDMIVTPNIMDKMRCLKTDSNSVQQHQIPKVLLDWM